MENISLEQIDLIMQRANVSYTEAKEALEQCGGDTVEALLLLEKAQKIKHQASSTNRPIKEFFKKLHATSFILYNQEKTLLDIPLTIALLALIFCAHVSIIAFVIALILGYKVDIKGQNPVAEKINSTIDFIKK